MAHEMLIGMLIKDESGYQRYREAMLPILIEHGGGFRYDFRVSDVLKTQAEHQINRVFTVFFKDKIARDSFFSNDAYKDVRKRFFEPSVGGMTVIAEYGIEVSTP